MRSVYDYDYDGCMTVVLLLYDGCLMVVLWLYDGSKAV